MARIVGYSMSEAHAMLSASRRQNHGQTGRTMVKTSWEPWSTGRWNPFRAEFETFRARPEFDSCRSKSVVAGLNSAFPAGSCRIPAPESVLAKQGNRPATAPVRSAWIEPQPWSIRPEAPVGLARAMFVRVAAMVNRR